MHKEKWNSGWKFWVDNSPFELVFRVPREAIDVELPHDAMFHEEQRPNSVNRGSTGNIDARNYKYYKTFFVPEDWKGDHITLQFEGIYRHAMVYVNRSLVAQCAYGYIDFFAEIQDYLKFGEENEVMVAVKTGTQSSRWYSGGGIYRDVYLHRGPAVYVKPYSLRLTTKDIDEEGAAVEIRALIANDGMTAMTCNAQVSMLEEDGTTVVCNSYPVRIRSHSQVEFRKVVYVKNAKLWNEETPNLYQVKFQISEKPEERDEVFLDEDSITTGIRKLMLDSVHGLRVNGKSVKFRGACIHHDQGLLGAATYDDYEYFRVKKLKEAGFNAVRSAHNPASQALLRACDRLGVYVMDELTDAWNKSKTHQDYSQVFEKDWEKDVEAMVAADYNHPSVIFYSTGNEISEICSEKGFETSQMLGDKLHELDPGRYVTNGINGAFAAGDGLEKIVLDITGGKQEAGKGDVNMFMGALENHMPQIAAHDVVGDILHKLETTMDVIGYNYMTSRYLMDAKRYPDRLMIGSETYPKQIAENWDAITRCPAALGDFTWTGYDYMGEVRGNMELFNVGGDVSAIGVRRPMSYLREIVFGLAKGPVITVQNPENYGCSRNFGPWKYTDCTFSYRYDGQEGKPMMIEVYAGGDSVELFQNGKSLGMCPCGKETAFVVKYDAVYEPGELMAVAYENGVEIGRSVLTTTGTASQIRLEQEMAECNELGFVKITLMDAEGQTDYNADRLIQVELEGPAELVGFGSERSIHDHGFEKPEAIAAEGSALAIVKYAGNAGIVRLRVSGEGLETAEISWEI